MEDNCNMNATQLLTERGSGSGMGDGGRCVDSENSFPKAY